MARARRESNGRIDRLEEAMAAMIQSTVALNQNQIAFTARLAEIDARIAEMDRINTQRFARIEAILMEHTEILREHHRMLEALPEAVRRKFGFQPPGAEE